MLDRYLGPQLGLTTKALVVPLGVSASSGVRYLCEKNII